MSQLVGKIAQIIGPVVDVRFEGASGELPKIYEALEVTKSNGQAVILEGAFGSTITTFERRRNAWHYYSITFERRRSVWHYYSNV